MFRRTLVWLCFLNIHHFSESSKSIVFANNATKILPPTNPGVSEVIFIEKGGSVPFVTKTTGILLSSLRSLMVNLNLVKEPLSGYLILSRDTHYSEYLAASDERRAFISGFDGTAGDALVTSTKALLWTDGRYHTQASTQMDENWTLIKVGTPGIPSQGEWINKEMPKGSVIGVDPKLITMDEWTRLQRELAQGGNKLVAVETNLVEHIWLDRPPQPSNPIKELPLEFTGRSKEDKLADVRKELEKQGANYLLVSELDEIAWLLNWRGSDILYSTVFFSYLIVGRNSLQIFVDRKKLTDTLTESFFKEKNLEFHNYEDIRQSLEKLATNASDEKIWVSKYASYHLASLIPPTKRIIRMTPIAYMKAIKNPVEVKGMKNCHVRDAVAVCQLFGWLEKSMHAGQLLTEAEASKKVKEFRSKLPNYVKKSFPTIAGSGLNGAYIHYSSESAPVPRLLSLREILLVDSGGQYLDGTTDVTRTIHFGQPTAFQKECYTRVLKGQINLVNSVFPNKLVGNYLDAFARQALWNVGLNYMHGTSHGIGSFLNVHEGPSGISWRPFPDDLGIQENMFFSNEPGYYHENDFGIRLENIVRVVKAFPKFNYGTRGFLTFEDVTMVPYQQKMIDHSLLSPAEIKYINNYHKECRQKVGNYMKSIDIPETDPGYVWLLKETEPIKVAGNPCV